jgi:protease IV
MSDPQQHPDVSREPGWERTALERVALAAIQEQRAARRWRIFFRFVYLAVALVVLWFAFGSSGDEKITAGRHTALVKIDGEIASDTNANAEDINSALDDAFDDSNAVGVILSINSPGGSPVQSGIVYDEIRRLHHLHPDKPIYVVVGDTCASGAYYIAAAADRIYVDKASVVGSIGVRMDGFGLTGLMGKLGVERRLHTAGADKGDFDPFSPETPVMTAHAQQMLDQIHQQFIAAVKAGRGTRLHESPDLFSGMFWTGATSIDLGLADAYGTVASVSRDVLKAPDLVDYTVKESLTDRVARRFGASLGGAAMHSALAGAQALLR